MNPHDLPDDEQFRNRVVLICMVGVTAFALTFLGLLWAAWP